jgi:NADPH:quinone reductase-like Zn-dependent oxidoreductase
MPKAVRFDEYGGVDVLEVREVGRPTPGRGQVLVRVKAAAINPGEIAIREGAMAERWPATFPSGQGSDLAGVVEEVGDGVGVFAVGDEVLGYTHDRASQAEYVAVDEGNLVPRPAAVPWDVAGSLFVAPLAGYASIKAIAPNAGETVVVSAAAGGVGSVAAQLAVVADANVIGLAGEANHAWLRTRGIVPVTYGEGQAERIRDAAGGSIDAFADCFGDGYVDLAVELGVPVDRINSVIDFEAGNRLGIHNLGSSQVVSPETLAEVAQLVADGRVEIPIAATYPLDRVRDAYEDLARRHTRGKIVLHP